MNTNNKSNGFYRDIVLMYLLLVFFFINGCIIIKRYGKPEHAYHTVSMPDKPVKTEPLPNEEGDQKVEMAQRIAALKEELAAVRKNISDSIGKLPTDGAVSKFNKTEAPAKVEKTPVLTGVPSNINKRIVPKEEKITLKPVIPVKTVVPPMAASVQTPTVVKNDKPLAPLELKATKLDVHLVYAENGKVLNTSKARQGKAVQVLLNIEKSKQPQFADIYFRLIAPDGHVINNSAGIVVKYVNHNLPCTFSKHVHTSQTDFILYYTLKKPLKSGTYILAIYGKDCKVGEVKLELK